MLFRQYCMPISPFADPWAMRGEDIRGFTEYVDMVHAALGDYRCTIEVLVEEQDKVFAKMGFGGLHRGVFMGYKPSGKRVHWTGCALFTFRGEKVSDLWVLGDLKGLEEQLKRNNS